MHVEIPPRAPKASADAGRRAFLQAAGSLAVAAMIPTALGRSRQAVTGSPFDWVEIRPGVYASSNLASGGNCLAVAGGGGAILVDTKFPAFAGQISRDVLRLTGSPVTRVVNTHHHADHTGGNCEFSSSADVMSHANAKPRIEAQLNRNMQGITGGRRLAERMPSEFRDALLNDIALKLAEASTFTAASWAPKTTISAPRTGIDLGGQWVEIRHFGRPSHTDNDLVIHLKDANVIHTGDLVFNGLHPFFDANGGTDSAAWLDTLADVLALCDAETVVVPGHGPATNASAVRNQISYIEQLRESVKAGIDAGIPIDELRSQTFPFMEGLGLQNLRENAIVFVYNELTNA